MSQPKRDAERRRRNIRPVATEVVDVAELVSQEAEVPTPDPDWHPVAQRWYVSILKSGQALFYEPSDWMAAYVVAEDLSRQLSPQPIVTQSGDEQIVEWHEVPMNGAKLAAFLKAATALMLTEAERRRLFIEIERHRTEAPEAADPAIVTDRRMALLSGTA